MRKEKVMESEEKGEKGVESGRERERKIKERQTR